MCFQYAPRVYAGLRGICGDFNDWYPVWIATSGHPLNKFMAKIIHLVVGPNNSTPIHSPAVVGASGFQFNNLGLLYALKMIGDGKIFYCPCFSAK